MPLFSDLTAAWSRSDTSSDCFYHCSTHSIDSWELREFIPDSDPGETAQQIAEKRLGAVLKHFRECISEGKSPILAAVEACDLETLDFLLVSKMVPEIEINVAFFYMFLKYCDNEQNPLPREILPITKRLLECGADLKRLSACYLMPSPVCIAVDAGDYDLIELLCKHGAPLNKQMYRSDKVPLCLAAKNGRMDLIELLLKYNADVNTHSYHNSPLECALIHGHIDCARCLVNHGAKMDISLAIFSVIKTQDTEYMKILLQNYGNEIISCLLEDVKNGNNLLLKAVKSGNLEIIEHILQAGVDVNISQRSGVTPIVKSKNGAVALLLIRYGADVNHVTDFTNQTPLMHVLNNFYYYRTDSDKEEVVRVLLENGASVHARTWNGKTPLMLAASLEKHEVILQRLLHHGADCSDQDNDGNTALILAILLDCSNNAIILIQSMKNNTDLFNLQNSKGSTALTEAYNNGRVMTELIDSGADVNITDADGWTALHHAAQCFPLQSHLQVLISSGCDINHQNTIGLTPLMIAVHGCNYRFVYSLINLGADVNAVSCKNSSKTALSYFHEFQFHRKEIRCLEAFLDRGANASFLVPRIFPIIISYHQDIIPKLIKSGLGPTDFAIDDIPLSVHQCSMLPSVSPLCLALLIDNVPLARYFWRIMFMTISDLYLPSNKILRRLLQTNKYEKCLSFLDEVSSQPTSLFKMCFVAVTSAVGASPGREARVNKLPLPWIVKDMLLFKSDVDSFATPGNGDHKSNILFDVCDHFQNVSDTDSKEDNSEEDNSEENNSEEENSAVTSDVGAPPGHEARINKLPLPWIVKDMLSFKSDVDSFATPGNGDHKSNILFDVCDHFQDFSDTDSEEDYSEDDNSAVTSADGASPGREARINKLPWIVKNMLSFKSDVDSFATPENADHKSNILFDVYDHFQDVSDTDSEEDYSEEDNSEEDNSAVTSAVGESPGREARVNTLSLPWIVKDMPLFKSDVDSVATPGNGDNKSNILFDVCDHFQDLSDTDSEEDNSAVTSAVGASPGREARVNKLPLPWIVKDKLLFKSDVIKFGTPENGGHKSNILFDVCDHFQDVSDAYSEEDNSEEDNSAVTSADGESPGREARVNKLPLPS